MTVDQATEPWMPNGFPPPSFVVEAERATAMAGRGRWLAAAAILGALLLIAGILLIARNGDDGKTQLATDSSTTTTLAPEAAPIIPPAEGSQSAVTLPPGATSDATVPGGAPATTTTVAAAPVPGAPPPPPPGVLEVPAAIKLPDAFTNRPPVSGPLAVRNSGPTGLDFTTQVGTGISLSQASGSLAPGATLNLTVTFSPSRKDAQGNDITLPEGDYLGKIVFAGSGGSRTVEVRSVVAKPPTVASARTDEKFIEPSLASSNPCLADWSVRALVSDTTGVRDVTVLITEGANPPSPRLMVLEPDPRNTLQRGIWRLNQTRAPAGANIKIVRIVATDKLGAVLDRPVNEDISCPA